MLRERSRSGPAAHGGSHADAGYVELCVPGLDHARNLERMVAKQAGFAPSTLTYGPDLEVGRAESGHDSIPPDPESRRQYLACRNQMEGCSSVPPTQSSAARGWHHERTRRRLSVVSTRRDEFLVRLRYYK